MDTAGSVRFVPKEEAVRLMVWDWVSGNKEELDAIERIQKNWRKSRRMKLLQRHPYRKHVTPDGTFFYSKRDDPSQVTWCAPHVPDRHGLPIAYRDEAAMKALAAANAEYQKKRAAEKAKRQVFIDIIKEKHAVGKRRRDEEAARAARALFDKRWGDAFEFAREVRGAASASYFELIWWRRWRRVDGVTAAWSREGAIATPWSHACSCESSSLDAAAPSSRSHESPRRPASSTCSTRAPVTFPTRFTTSTRITGDRSKL